MSLGRIEAIPRLCVIPIKPTQVGTWQTGVMSIPTPLRFEMARPGLLQQLAASVDVPIVALVAPSGYGKSTLLAQYARASSRPVAWVRAGFKGSGAFESAMALTRALQSLGEPFDVTAAMSVQPDTPADVLTHWMLEVLGGLEHNVDIVVDGVEALNPDGLRWLDGLARGLGEGHRLLLSGYSLESLRLSKRAARDEMLVLDSSDLAFSHLEAEAYLSARGANALLNRDELHALQGWPAGLALAASGARGHVSPEDLVRDALQGLPDNVRDTLPEAAVLEVWSEAGGQNLDLKLPKGWLDTVVQYGLPLVGLRRGQYRPHRLLSDWLESELRARPDRFAILAQRAAVRAERLEETATALRLYTWAGNVNDAVRLATSLAAQYRARGEVRSVRHVLESVPFQALSSEFQCRLAFTLVETGDVTRGAALLEALRASDEIHPVGLAGLAVLAGRRGERELQLTLAKEALDRLEPGQTLPAASSPLVSALNALGRTEEALTHAQGFADRARKQGQAGEGVTALMLLASVYERQHRFLEQRGTLSEAVVRCREHRWPHRAAPLLIELGKLQAMAGEFGEATASFAEARDALEPDTFAFAVLLEARGLSALWEGDALGAQKHFAACADTAERISAKVVAQRARFWENDARRALGEPAVPGVGMQAAFEAVLEALHSARLEAARDRLEKLELTTASVPIVVRATALQVALLEGKDADVARTLWASWRGAIGPGVLVTEASALRRLGVRTESIAWLEGDTAKHSSTAPTGHRLELTSLGEFRVVLNKRDVPVTLMKSAELLVWLALHKSGTRERIVTALWGEDAEERHHGYFRVAVRRLRVALSTVFTDGNPVPMERNLYSLHPNLEPRLDLLEAERAPDSEARFEVLQRQFLPSAESEWADGVRARCARLALETGLHLAELSAEDTEAQAWYARVLTLDPLCDAAHQGRIERHWRSGALSDAQRCLLQYENIVFEQLDLGLEAGFLEKVRNWGLHTEMA
jgi:LuxR family transcriptional regulator, maltose regulon positive regulatory protein